MLLKLGLLATKIASVSFAKRIPLLRHEQHRYNRYAYTNENANGYSFSYRRISFVTSRNSRV